MKQLFSANFLRLLAIGTFGVFMAGCRVVDPAEDIPSYIHIEKMDLNAVGNQGTSISEITDAWVYMDGELIGGFELPCTVPILAEGDHHFIIRAGVMQNGLSATRAIYPFYKGWESDVHLTRGQKNDLGTLTVSYFPGNFPATWIEDFGGSGMSLNSSTNYFAQMRRRTDAQSLEGSYGYVLLNNDSQDVITYSADAFSLNASTEVWLEFDYNCNHNFSVGIYDNNYNYTEWVVVAPSYGWNKIYIRLTDALVDILNNGPYKIYFAMHYTGSGQANLYLDNIKLLK